MLGTIKELVDLLEEISQTWEVIDEILEEEGLHISYYKYRSRINSALRRYASLDASRHWRSVSVPFMFQHDVDGDSREVYIKTPKPETEVEKLSCTGAEAVAELVLFIFGSAANLCEQEGRKDFATELLRIGDTIANRANPQEER